MPFLWLLIKANTNERREEKKTKSEYACVFIFSFIYEYIYLFYFFFFFCSAWRRRFLGELSSRNWNWLLEYAKRLLTFTTSKTDAKIKQQNNIIHTHAKRERGRGKTTQKLRESLALQTARSISVCVCEEHAIKRNIFEILISFLLYLSL